MHGKRLFLLCLVVTLQSVSFDPKYTNKLTKVFYHQGQLSDKMVCYFSESPIWNQIPQRSDESSVDRIRIVYFLPKVSLANKDVQKMIRSLSNSTLHGNEYAIVVDTVTRPMQGVQISITYDPSKIAFTCEQFDAISQQKGLVFSFHHKDTLNQINQKTDSIMNYASNRHKPKVMLDFGHGGHDNGKIGLHGAIEKEVTLKVGKKVAMLLQKKGYNVVYTRTSDVFVPLDTRTSVTNKQRPDIFVSIHANGAVNERAEGIETYWMNPRLLTPKIVETDVPVDKTVALLAQRTSNKHKKLASTIHEYVMKSARTVYPAKDRTVKESVAQVLLGNDCTIPSTLVEIGFLSHEREAQLLATDSYQDTVARGICDGIIAFFNV